MESRNYTHFGTALEAQPVNPVYQPHITQRYGGSLESFFLQPVARAKAWLSHIDIYMPPSYAGSATLESNKRGTSKTVSYASFDKTYSLEYEEDIYISIVGLSHPPPSPITWKTCGPST